MNFFPRQGNPHFSEYIYPKKVFLFWSLPSRNTQEYYEADDEKDSPHQGQRGDLVQAGEVLKILKYVNAMEAWDEHYININFVKQWIQISFFDQYRDGALSFRKVCNLRLKENELKMKK